MLRIHTSENIQQHIDDKLMEKTKEILTSSNLSATQVADLLGFEHR